MVPIAFEGFRIIAFFFIIFAVSLIWQNWYISGLFFIIFLFILLFFRDPKRAIEREPNVIYSPADGKVLEIKEIIYDEKPYYQVIIFLSVFNCHINRVPFKGKVVTTKYFPGKYLAAFKKGIETKNARQETIIETEKGLMKFVQITGAIARRIVCHLKDRQPVESGERFGLIKFGSRTDLYFSRAAKVLVKKGQCVKGGLTQIASF